jgi:cytochrome c biogenesis protein CcmG/thiol:disulfide interchange protein DsbE
VNRRAFLLWLPLAVFIGLATAFVLSLHKPDDRTIVSKMVGATVPDFALPAATEGIPPLASTDLKGQGPHLVNFFASWCIPCISEAGVLGQLAQAGVPIVGIALRDRREAVAAFLARNGNPYKRIGSDLHGQTQIDFGSSGVPETFVVDGAGMIRLQIIGPIGPQHLDDIKKALVS